MFHLRDGFMFGRNEDGSVTVRVLKGGLADGETVAEVTVPDNEWASVLASTCARGETGETYAEAMDFLAVERVEVGQPPAPSLDDVVYVIAVRSAAPKDGREIPPLLNGLRRAGVEPVTAPLAAAKAIRDSGSSDHAALVRLGFEWHQANTIFTVVAESPTDDNERTP